MDEQVIIWILERLKERCGVTELANHFIDLYQRFDFYNMWIEDTAAGTPAVDVLRDRMPGLPTELVTPSQGGKRSRAHALSPFLHSGQVRFPIGAHWFEDCKYYLTHFGLTDHDDDVDALFQLVISGLTQTVHPDVYGKNRPQPRLRMR